MNEDIDYLDKEFPKGETKFRGQAMVLLALARKEGARLKIEEILEKWEDEESNEYNLTEKNLKEITK